jgi:hypothetical protein
VDGLKLQNQITLQDVKKNEKILAYIVKADVQMNAIGYAEHGFRHADLVAHIAYNILDHLGYSKRAELAAIAGYLHDIGNVISRCNHGQIGALLVMQILNEMKMKADEIAEVSGAIGNHEEENGDVVSIISAAQILADKSDVHKSRVRNPNTLRFDIHDRVNYAVEKSFLRVEKESKTITLDLKIDTKISKIYAIGRLMEEGKVIK